MTDKEKKKKTLVYIGVGFVLIIVFMSLAFGATGQKESGDEDTGSAEVMQDIPHGQETPVSTDVSITPDKTNADLSSVEKEGYSDYYAYGSSLGDNIHPEDIDLSKINEQPSGKENPLTEGVDLSSEDYYSKAYESTMNDYRKRSGLSDMSDGSSSREQEYESLKKERDEYKELYEQGVIDRNAIIASASNVGENSSSRNIKKSKGNTGCDVTNVEETDNFQLPRPTVQVARSGVVSSLSGTQFNNAFYGEASRGEVPRGNVIPAVVEKQHIVRSGDFIKMRLTSPIMIGNLKIPAGEEIVGRATINGTRLNVTVESIKYKDNITPIEMSVYDLDGQRGIAIGSSEFGKAGKTLGNSVARGVSSAGSSALGGITMTDAKGAIAQEVTRGVLGTVADFISSRSNDVKVRVKAGHHVVLLPNEQSLR